MRARQQLLLLLAFAVLMLFGLILLGDRPLAPARHTVTTQTMPKPLPVERARDVSPTVDRTLPATVRAPTVTDPSQGMAYVVANLERARAGDHRAQFYIGNIVSKCESDYHLYLAGVPLIDPQARGWSYCSSFEHPELLETSGQVWIDKALKGGDPLALLVVANEHYWTTDRTPEARADLNYAIRLVEQSGDAEALALLENLPEVP